MATWVAAAIASLATANVVAKRVDLYLATRTHVAVTSTVDGATYHVVDVPNKQHAADLLARVSASAVRVIREVDRRVDAVGLKAAVVDTRLHNGVCRLRKYLPGGRNLAVYELDYFNEPHLAYNRNKTDGIFLCLRQTPQTGELAADDTVLFILLHEIAHTMTPHFDPMEGNQTKHSPLFRAHEHYLHEVARDLGLLTPENVHGRRHCRATILPPAESV